MNLQSFKTETVKFLKGLDLFKTVGGDGIQNSRKFSDNQDFCNSLTEGQKVIISVEQVHELVSVGNTNKAGYATPIPSLKAVVTVKIGEKTCEGQIYINDVAVAALNGGSYEATVLKGEFQKRVGLDADKNPITESRQWVAFSASQKLDKVQLAEQLAKIPEFSGAFTADTVN